MLGFWTVKTTFLPVIHNSLQDIQPMSAQNLFEDISSCTWPSPHIVSCLSLTSSVRWTRSDSPCWCASVDSHVSLHFRADRCFFGSFWQLLKPYFTLHSHRNCCDVLHMDSWFSFKRSTDDFVFVHRYGNFLPVVKWIFSFLTSQEFTSILLFCFYCHTY